MLVTTLLLSHNILVYRPSLLRHPQREVYFTKSRPIPEVDSRGVFTFGFNGPQKSPPFPAVLTNVLNDNPELHVENRLRERAYFMINCVQQARTSFANVAAVNEQN